ncbi:PAS domain-containing sensor histidine kinase [Variovorax sp. J22R133]|uniref:two-component system sensor histidine kinase NtrB n=1 Tax=Variovorax brevis TaxID=3053503 RepID=UPI0025751CFC|nr:PAS domain-containing sensor histidine kinase [Variovorax sp. J22R133]MDM0114543.1 PAS domain-containing sensor histidine kinase [Variovorax sp. J22R133]
MTPLLWSRGESATDWGTLGANTGKSSALLRLWRGFMTARCFVAAVLVTLQALTIGIAHATPPAPLWVSGAYLVVALLGARFLRFQPPLRSFGLAWIVTIAIDLSVFALLQLLQAGNINYTPLFALPVLMAAVLGTVSVGLGTTAAATLLLLGDASWHWMQSPGDSSARFVQAALTGTGLFVVSLLAHELALRLAREETMALRSRTTARMHALVNDLVIETLSEGVLVVDANGLVHAANPAAGDILGKDLANLPLPFALDAHPAWHALAALALQTFSRGKGQSKEIPIAQMHGSPLEVRVRTRLTPASDQRIDRLCVMFLQDLRELEARIRTEKLAAMGRMSAAVAHEIRNPLAAITQASALLSEDLLEPGQRKLTEMVQHNAQRLARIVDDVLDVSRARQQRMLPLGEQVTLDSTVRTLAGEWVQQTQRQGILLQLDAAGRDVRFDGEHLRRILVNLLDNAARYAGDREGSIQIATRQLPNGRATLQVWSDGAPLEAAVQRHLFEPFFSSESRSSGLGLFICRELCERHGATIGYDRRALTANGPEGNEFHVSFASAEMRLTQ